MINIAIRLAEKGILPDFLIRIGINNFIKQRYKEVGEKWKGLVGWSLFSYN